MADKKDNAGIIPDLTSGEDLISFSGPMKFSKEWDKDLVSIILSFVANRNNVDLVMKKILKDSKEILEDDQEELLEKAIIFLQKIGEGDIILDIIDSVYARTNHFFMAYFINTKLKKENKLKIWKYFWKASIDEDDYKNAGVLMLFDSDIMIPLETLPFLEKVLATFSKVDESHYVVEILKRLWKIKSGYKTCKNRCRDFVRQYLEKNPRMFKKVFDQDMIKKYKIKFL